MQFAKRLDRLPPYLFVDINRRIADLRAQGVDIVTFAIGDPDMPTPLHIIERICKEAHVPANHRYPETDGLPELHEAIADWYWSRFGVELDPETEVLPLIGSKEGIGHIALCFVEPGSIVLVPDPGYPVYSMSTMIAGGNAYYMPLTAANDFIPDLDAIPPHVASRATMMWLNYPNNPTGAGASLEFFERVVAFAAKYDIVVCHDAPYTEVYFDGRKPPSFMQAKGARDVGVEFHSLSKTYHMTGWRIGMVVGNKDVIRALFTVKSNLDSGIPQAIQLAAVEALRGPQDIVAEHNAVLQRRRDMLVEVLNRIGLKARVPDGTFYVWARVPDDYSCVSLTRELLDKVHVAVTPGIGYGAQGENFVRFSITLPDDRLEEGVRRLASWRGGTT
ncbi:MAG TPA: aminotransferase class I/II-fold pyridoxal phosphate-dependent enzyme [Dehalococcoidia bacterium]|nr:aminotransferase class I/II-fold pyridoxal phosphate-dependent enzyme [Dehalococcoidia bacterium]